MTFCPETRMLCWCILSTNWNRMPFLTSRYDPSTRLPLIGREVRRRLCGSRQAVELECTVSASKCATPSCSVRIITFAGSLNKLILLSWFALCYFSSICLLTINKRFLLTLICFPCKFGYQDLLKCQVKGYDLLMTTALPVSSWLAVPVPHLPVQISSTGSVIKTLQLKNDQLKLTGHLEFFSALI